MARVGPQRHRRKNKEFLCQNFYINTDVNYTIVLLASSINATCLIRDIPLCCNNKVIFTVFSCGAAAQRGPWPPH